MGLDVDAFLMVAIPINGRSDFFEKIGEELACPAGHKPDTPGQKFCPQDGKPFKTQAITRARPTFAAAAKAAGQSPEDFYASIDGHYNDKEPSIRVISSLQSSEDRSDELGFGIKIKGASLRGRGETASLTAAEFDAIRAQVETAARICGIEGEAKIFCCMYVSV